MKLKIIVSAVAALFLFALGAGAAQAATCPGTDFKYTVSLPGGATVDMHVKRTVNNSSGKDLFLVHGFGHKLAYFDQFTNKIVADPTFDASTNRIREIYAVDLPAHGGSSIPTGKTIRTVNFDDYVNSVEKVLEKIKADCADGAVELIGGHSMGGLVLQGIGQDLKSKGTSIKASYGSTGILNLASIFPQQVYWAYDDWQHAKPLGLFSSQLLQDLLKGGLVNILFGGYAQFQLFDFNRLFYTNYVAQPPTVPQPPKPFYPIASAPHNDTEMNQIANKEPLTAGLQITALDADHARPYVDGGVYSGLKLGSVCYEKDYFMTKAECQNLNSYLGGATDVFYNTGPDAIHNAEYTFPATTSLLPGTKDALKYVTQ